MKVSVGVHSPGGLPGSICLELPDDYQIGPNLWSDLQDLISKEISSAKEQGKIADFLIGVSGDRRFVEKMNSFIAASADGEK